MLEILGDSFVQGVVTCVDLEAWHFQFSARFAMLHRLADLLIA